jgi:peptidoglycan/LPS O-acetylase OafA/YrhL
MTARDDRVLAATRWAALVVFIILVPAVVVLWGTPSHTHDRWAWTIKPDLMPIFLGAGYGAGAYFFWRTFRARVWHPSSAGVLGASVFAALMLTATLIHWGRFNHGHAPLLAAFAFWGWLIVYIISPLSCSPCGGVTARPIRGNRCPTIRSCPPASSWPPGQEGCLP